MDLTGRLQSAALICFLITIIIESSHTRLTAFSTEEDVRNDFTTFKLQHGRRHKRQHGEHLYLPESYVVPGGDHGDWGEWGSPSECSRTCGGGVAYQTRECLSLRSDGSSRCRGGSKKFFTCNSQDCPEDELDFRQQQCAHFSSVPFEGVHYDWVPYTKAPNPCELNCMPRGERFYYRHKAKVIDGTRCNDESLDVCVDGQCQSVGCDMMLGSSAREDQCRKCTGDGSSCKTVSGTLDMNNLQMGYNDILLIPSGATNIEIKEVAPSNNYLAIRNLTGFYYLNGNWRIDFPRPLTFAGSIWHYDRRPQGFAAPDHVSCIGPSSEPVYLVLLYQDRNVGISYEYSVPESSAHLPEPDTYVWSFQQYGECSVSCGGGFQTRPVLCNSRTTLEEVDAELCDPSLKPVDTQQCGHKSCPPKWVEGAYGNCSMPCGENGTQSRTVHCEQIVSAGVSKTVADAICLENVGNKPATSAACNVGVVCAEWHIGAWQPCNKLCGEGTQKRQIKCFRKIAAKIEVLNDVDCLETKPEAEKSCTLRPCEGVDWITSSWSGCKACGLTTETRKAYCASQKGKIFNETFCANRKVPELSRPCEAAQACKFQWFKSQWSVCSTECGKGIQNRRVICAELDGTAIKPSADESKCSGDEKPADTKECEGKTKVCPGEWFTGPFSDCNKPCGGGERTREVLCIANGENVKKTDCNSETFESKREECNKHPCTDDQMIPVDSKSKPIVEDDEGEDYCDDDEDSEFDEITGVIKADTTASLGDAIDLDDTSDSQRKTTIVSEDELMLSDSTGFEADFTQTDDGVTGSSFATEDGSGYFTSDSRFDGTAEGSGDETKSMTTILSSVTDSYSSASDSQSDTVTDSIASTYSTVLSIADESNISSKSVSDSSSTDLPPDSSASTVSSGTDDSSVPTESVTALVSSSSSNDVSTETTVDSGSAETESDGTDETLSVIILTTEWSVSTETDSTAQTTEEGITTTNESTTVSTDVSTTDSSTESTTDASSDPTTTTDLSTDTTTDTSTSAATDSSSLAASSDTSSSDSGSTTVESGDTTTDTVTEQSTIGASTTSADGQSTDDSSTGASVSTDSSTGTSVSTESSDATTLSGSSQFSAAASDASSTDPSTIESSTIDSSTIDSSTIDSTTDLSGETTTDSGTELTTIDASTTVANELSSVVSESTDNSGASTLSSGASESTEDISTVTALDGSTETDATTSTDDFTDSSTLQGEETTTDSIVSSSDDIWSSSSDSTDEESTAQYGSTPNTLESIIIKEQTPRKCKPRPKVAACSKSTFGCCSDNSTAAKGPFDEGCPVEETCAQTKYGCCSDGVSPAEGKKNKGCPDAVCFSSLFGCCSDNVTEAENAELEGCPIVLVTTTVGGCASSKFGCCDDGFAEATGPEQDGCGYDETTTATDEDISETPSVSETPSAKDCKLSQFGCCPDDLSEATGEAYHGCETGSTDSSVIADCTSSEFGCCPDNWTLAQGANREGCSPCLVEPFGCCQDGITPAHGQNGEGCCLDSEFGCCPNNVQPARGPNLEGCGCEYSPYGCCPDKNTSASGYDNEGCGCQYSRFGCCLDKLTPANGPKYEGCPCHTFQFGCCPNGITVPTGPHNYGCSCTQTEFKCCSDEKTPAQGPNFEGCTCATSKFGCCPNGVDEASGDKFDGCQDIPVVPQKACGLMKDQGNGSTFSVKHFFDVEYGACSRFWYSSSGGNDNRFDTVEECKATCEQPESKAACMLPKSRGPCTGYFVSYYFDSDRNACSQFVFGGCLGNNNRFETIEACQSMCAVDTSSPPCDQPVEQGPCQGSFESWYYDKESDSCSRFAYGGCKGNQNRYATEHACNYHCKTPGVHKASCALPKETGTCQARHARWYYSESDKKCMPFYYSGCGGNKNSYVSLEDCEAQCPPEIIKELCYKPAEVGEGQDYTARWYYDTKAERCRQFYYGGYGGNDNNFQDEESCLRRCDKRVDATEAPLQPPRQRPQEPERQPEREREREREPQQEREREPEREPERQQPKPDRPFRTEFCFLDSDSGECRISEARYYYNKNEGVCDVFTYGGCGGNENNFMSSDECEQSCGNVQDACSLPPVYGLAQENSTRYYYDSRSKECVTFVYSGCCGNKNNFYTENECLDQCQRYQAPAEDHTQAPPADVDEQHESICSAPLHYGDCNDQIRSYFYDERRESCEEFDYTGCGGNGNRFDTKEQCESQCGKHVEVDVCHERVDPGPCDQWQTNFFYNETTRKCAVFTYGGCAGTGNRFSSQNECETRCIGHVEPIALDSKAICALPAEMGKCKDYKDTYKRWFYDDSRGTCMSFIYFGCGGNQNNFLTLDSCNKFCSIQPDQENHIDHGDYRTAKPDACKNNADECKRMQCPYGVSRSYDDDGCLRCSCENPCQSYECPEGSTCAIDISPDQQSDHSFAPVCRSTNKPGECPPLSNDASSTSCGRECYTDADCRGDSKCCVSGCSHVCVLPNETVDVTQAPPPEEIPRPEAHPGIQAPGLEQISQEEVDVVQPAGQVATLRCYATGYPLPTVTWSFGSITIDTNQGRFRLTTTGDLQIVQVHQSDSGSYLCVADNGYGPPVQRDVNLRITDLVLGDAYILGDNNATQIVTLGQRATVRCLAGGHPKPDVSWWRSTEMLPLKSARHEVTVDNSLVFFQIGLTDLGPYTCHAWSGTGRPVSIYITLKAVGPVHFNDPIEEQYAQYLVSAPQVPSTPRPYRPYRPVRPLPRPPIHVNIPTHVEEGIPRSAIVPLTSNINLPNGNVFSVGSDMSLQCDVQGYPKPIVTWYKDQIEIQPSDRIQISESNRLIVLGTTNDDSGYYKCAARNEYSQSSSEEQIIIEGVYVHPECTDNPFFANCKLIVKAKYCTHKYYAKFCCRSCTLAGQLH